MPITTRSYSVEVGYFALGDGSLKFGKPVLMLPFVGYTLIGKAKDQIELARCTGGTIGCVEGKGLLPMGITFPERIGYDGTKIIIPPHNSMGQPFLSIDRDHGALAIDEKCNAYYRHLTGKYVTYLSDGQAIINSVQEAGKDVNLQFPDARKEYFLLLGGKQGETLEDKFKLNFEDVWVKVYVRVIRDS